MHAGGVAESSAPWNDDKDPFEVDSTIIKDYLQKEAWNFLFTDSFSLN